MPEKKYMLCKLWHHQAVYPSCRMADSLKLNVNPDKLPFADNRKKTLKNKLNTSCMI